MPEQENTTPVSPAMSPAVAELRTNLKDLITESQALRTDVHSAEEARRRATRVNVALLALLTLFVGLLLVVTWQNNRLIGQVEETNTLMADCTTPGGNCYQQSAKRTSNAISDIVWASVYMAQCSRLYPGEVGPGYDRKLEACVTERLRKAAQERQPPAAPTPSPTPTGGG
jgi:hypothetical protein